MSLPAGIKCIEINRFKNFPEFIVKTHDKETLMFDVSPDNKFLGSVGNGRSELLILDVVNDFKQVSHVNFGIFDKKWDLILSSSSIDFRVLGRNLVAFYSEKLTFRFINFGKSKASSFNFLSQNRYSKFDVKPADEAGLLPMDSAKLLAPVYRVTHSERAEPDNYHVVGSQGGVSSRRPKIRPALQRQDRRVQVRGQKLQLG